MPDPLTPELVNPDDARFSHASHRKVQWRCPSDPRHTWFATMASRYKQKSGCPICAGRLPLVGVTDIETLYPEVFSRIVDKKAAALIPVGSAKKIEFRCPKGHIFTSEVRKQTGYKNAKITNCPTCAGRKSHTKQPLAITLKPELLDECTDPKTLKTLTAGSGVVLTWRCTACAKEHTYPMSVRRKMKSKRCPVQNGKLIVPGINDLATTHPDLAASLVDQSLATQVSRGSEHTLTWRCSQGHTYEAPVYARVAGNGCPHCYTGGTSKLEAEILSVVKALIPSAQHHATINGHEVDILANDLAIEVNGLFWHSDGIVKDPMRHKRKRDAVLAQGYRFHAVWEDQWRNAKPIVINTLASRLHARDRLEHAYAAAKLPYIKPQRYHARKLRLGTLSHAEAQEFFAAHHIQGATVLTTTYALFHEDTPVAALGLRSARHNARLHRREGEWEIQRYATSAHVPGGFSKLLAYAQKELSPQKWITFAAHDVSDGNLYERCGFTLESTIPPTYSYTGSPHARNQRVPKESFQLSTFKKRDDLLYEEGWTEREAALANGLLRIYDYGKSKYVKMCG